MSYPPPLYDGTTGEVSATIRPNDTRPRCDLPQREPRPLPVDRRLDRAPVRALPLGVRRAAQRPGRALPPDHDRVVLHPVRRGQHLRRDPLEPHRGPATTRTCPPGGLHGFRNESGAASMLLHFAPGAPREAYFEGLARAAAGETMTEPSATSSCATTTTTGWTEHQLLGRCPTQLGGELEADGEPHHRVLEVQASKVGDAVHPVPHRVGVHVDRRVPPASGAPGGPARRPGSAGSRCRAAASWSRNTASGPSRSPRQRARGTRDGHLAPTPPRAWPPRLPSPTDRSASCASPLERASPTGPYAGRPARADRRPPRREPGRRPRRARPTCLVRVVVSRTTAYTRPSRSASSGWFHACRRHTDSHRSSSRDRVTLPAQRDHAPRPRGQPVLARRPRCQTGPRAARSAATRRDRSAWARSRSRCSATTEEVCTSSRHHGRRWPLLDDRPDRPQPLATGAHRDDQARLGATRSRDEDGLGRARQTPEDALRTQASRGPRRARAGRRWSRPARGRRGPGGRSRRAPGDWASSIVTGASTSVAAASARAKRSSCTGASSAPAGADRPPGR